MTRLLLVCGDQLFPVAEYRRAFPIDSVAEIVMVEDQELCSRRPLHQQKLTLVLAAMRHQAVALENAGYTVQYARLGDAQNLARMLKARKRATSATTLATFAVANVGQRRWIQAAADTAKLDLSYASTPMFLTSDETFESLTGKRRPLQMGRFYQAQRKRLNVLVTDDGEPRGERWSFDEDNRRALPAKQVVPDLPEIELDPITAEVADEVAARFSKHPGTAHELWLPTERRGALRWLRTFLDERLVGFGTYEDAISTRSATLFHSALSPLLNLGLVTPAEVLERVLAHAETNTVPINDLEGFVRQLIGWREFIRGVYVTDGAAMRAANQRNQRRLPGPGWRAGTLGLPPYDDAIATLERYGWNHHIDRLMVIANLMNLAELHPHSVYDFFQDNYLDAYDWVMVPNVYGMGLNSDDNTFATKPYICGSNYWLKMSDYKKGDWCAVVDGLYWRFVDQHRETLASNPRTAVMPRNLDRLKPERRSQIFSAADRFLTEHTTEAGR